MYVGGCEGSGFRVGRWASPILTYIYMVDDLKVLVRSFNCESRACYVGNPRESFFSSLRK